ncbi:hypothetical protein [Natranaerofaba carboxydovora]|uniref:hypothetical protein n=1 Tax=Natranaerofaba carboxydovora TaxID=2742683 RepID=UPI001F143EA3|nr:hypothetical protein [Natranaerofaba carboxydovora]UMZ73022.1 hypothetical protein ACONDI_00566 [Natranaerofaba carboxydovora]
MSNNNDAVEKDSLRIYEYNINVISEKLNNWYDNYVRRYKDIKGSDVLFELVFNSVYHAGLKVNVDIDEIVDDVF